MLPTLGNGISDNKSSKLTKQEILSKNYRNNALHSPCVDEKRLGSIIILEKNKPYSI